MREFLYPNRYVVDETQHSISEFGESLVCKKVLMLSIYIGLGSPDHEKIEREEPRSHEEFMVQSKERWTADQIIEKALGRKDGTLELPIIVDGVKRIDIPNALMNFPDWEITAVGFLANPDSESPRQTIRVHGFISFYNIGYLMGHEIEIATDIPLIPPQQEGLK